MLPTLSALSLDFAALIHMLAALGMPRADDVVKVLPLTLCPDATADNESGTCSLKDPTHLATIARMMQGLAPHDIQLSFLNYLTSLAEEVSQLEQQTQVDKLLYYGSLRDKSACLRKWSACM